jgi:hypothetical protein
MPQPTGLWQVERMKNGSPEELDFAYDDDFAVFVFGRGRRQGPRRKNRILRKRVRVIRTGRKAK